MSFKRKEANPQQANGKGKAAQPSKAARITLKLEITDVLAYVTDR